MATDPKKNDELKDEELEGVAGGAEGDIDRPDQTDAPAPKQKPEQLR